MADFYIATKVSSKIPNRYRREEMIKLFKRHMKDAHNRAVSDAKSLLKTAIRVSGSNATGNLLRSVSSNLIKNNDSDDMVINSEVGFSGTAAQYAHYANYGRRAGTPPPVYPIYKWVLARGIEENRMWAIIKHIAEYGTEGHHFMELVIPKINRNNKKVISEASRNFKRELTNG